MDGRKINSDQENPIDDILISLCDPLSDVLRRLFPWLTPNMITTVGMLFGFLTFYFILKHNYVLAFCMFWISYFLDCLDGYYARKYKMMSKFGDFYDHIRDVLVTGSIIILIFIKLQTKPLKATFTVMTLLFLFVFLMHMGCQEKNSKIKDHNHSLSPLQNLCKQEEWIHQTKYVGNGTFILILSIFILLLYVGGNNTRNV